MIEARPASIRYFEHLTVASFAVGLLHQLSSTTVGLVGTFVVAAITIGLALLASRRRKNWARWVLTIMFVLGAGFTVLDMRAVLAIGYPLVTVLVFLLQAIALALLFTQEASDWFHRKPSLAETFT